jgi:hypothetical protein
MVQYNTSLFSHSVPSAIAQMERMDVMGVETLTFADALCIALDMVKPAVLTRITYRFTSFVDVFVHFMSQHCRLADLKRCKQAKLFFNMFFNLTKVPIVCLANRQTSHMPVCAVSCL